MSVAVLLMPLLVASTADAAARGPNADERRYAAVAYEKTMNHREARGLRVLDRESCVQRYAARQAARMARRNRMFHQDLGPILRRCGLSAVGENVAMGYPSGAAVVRGWMGSEGHRRNILSRSYDVIGVAARRSSNGTWFAAQVFGGG